MRSEVLRIAEQLAPKDFAFILAVLYRVIFNKFRTLQFFIVDQWFEIERKWLKLLDAILHILVDLGNVELYDSEGL